MVAQEIESISAGLVSESIDRDPDTDADLGTKTKSVKYSSLGIDTEGSGLQIPHRDKLSLVQFSTGNNDAYIIQPDRKNYRAPNLVKIFVVLSHL